MRFLTPALLVLIIPSLALAVVDPEPNSIGMYFDANANINAIDVTPMDPDYPRENHFDAYIIITNMTEEYLDAFTVSYRLVVPEGREHSFLKIGEVIYGWFGCWIDPPWSGLLSGEFSLGLAQPRYETPALPLVRWTFIILEDMWIEFYLGPSAICPPDHGQPEYWVAGTGAFPLQISSGSPDLPVARINGPAPVPTESASFGTVKALYR